MENYHLIYDDVNLSFKIDKSDIDKYIVFTCAKGEDKYIVEFVEHYLKLGFDKIIIADNNDEPTLETLLNKFIIKGQVELFNCRGIKHFQGHIYSMFLREGNYKWCAYFDADEFLEIPTFKDVKEFLSFIKEDCVLFQWLIFGSCGEYAIKNENYSIQNRFKVPCLPILGCKENIFIKSIVRGGDTFKEGWFDASHLPNRNFNTLYNIGGDFVTNIPCQNYFPLRYKNGYLKHYYTKSLEEWMDKEKRGWPDYKGAPSHTTFYLFNNATKPTIDRFTWSMFDMNSLVYKEKCKNMETYDVVKLTVKDYPYANIYDIINILHCAKNKTFVIDGDIDETFFILFLEHAFLTDNNLLWLSPKTDMWDVFTKYNKNNNDTYFIFHV